VEEALIRARIFVMDRSGSDASFRAVLMLVRTLIREDGGSKPGRMSTDLSVCPVCKASPATRDSTQSAMPGRKSFHTIQERPNGMKSVGIHRRVLIQAPPTARWSAPRCAKTNYLGRGGVTRDVCRGEIKFVRLGTGRARAGRKGRAAGRTRSRCRTGTALASASSRLQPAAPRPISSRCVLEGLRSSL
jgi:hypothetical protein